MNYTDKEIEYYLSFLNPDGGNTPNTIQDLDRKVRCWNCHSDRFFVKLGYNICEKCGASNGHALGFE